MELAVVEIWQHQDFHFYDPWQAQPWVSEALIARRGVLPWVDEEEPLVRQADCRPCCLGTEAAVADIHLAPSRVLSLQIQIRVLSPSLFHHTSDSFGSFMPSRVSSKPTA